MATNKPASESTQSPLVVNFQFGSEEVQAGIDALREKLASRERMLTGIINHFNEFGMEFGLDVLIESAERTLKGLPHPDYNGDRYS